jgi:hypothetical protein
MFLLLGALLLVDSEGAALLHEVPTTRLIPFVANELHDVWSILGKLPEEGTIMHLMPYVVHDIQLLAPTLHLIGAHKEVHKKAMYFILVGVLGVDGDVIDAVYDVVDQKKIIGTSTQSFPGNVEVDDFLLCHWFVIKVNPEEVDIVVGEIIGNAPRKILPCGLHLELLSHPLQ